MFKINITQKAQKDLRNIWFYTFDIWGMHQADKYLNEMQFTMNHILLSNPKIGIACSFIEKDYRQYQFQKHVIFYKFSTKSINIIRVLHQNMKFENNIN